MSRSRAVVLGLALVLAWVGSAGPARADAPAVTAVGWWTRSPVAGAPPQGGLTVGNAPDGAVSVAAITVAEGRAEPLELHLTEAGGLVAETAGVLACGTTNGWVPGAGGPLAEAPKPDCSTNVTLVRDDVGAWSADLLPLVRGRSGPVSIMLIPGASPALPGVSLAWEVTFQPPDVRGETQTSPAPAPTAEPAPAAVTAGSFAALEPADVPTAVMAPPLPTPVAAVPMPSPVIGGVPTPISLGGEPGTAWGLLFPVALAALLVGVLGGGIRWSLLSGPLVELRRTLLTRAQFRSRTQY